MVNYYNNIVGDPQKGKAIFDSLYPKLRNSGNRNKASLYLNLGDSYLFLADTQNALDCYKQAFVYADKAGDEKLKGYSLLYQSDIIGESGDFAKASRYLVSASEIFNKLKDTFNIVSAKGSLIILYSKNGFFKEAEKVRTEAIALAEATHNYGQLAVLYNNRGAEETKNYQSKLYFLEKALINCRKSNYEATLEPNILSSMISIYAQSDQVPLAEKHLDTLLAKYPDVKSSDKRKAYLVAMRYLSAAKGNYAQAISSSIEQLAIDHQLHDVTSIRDVELFLSDVYEKMGNFEQSSHHLKEYGRIKDSIFSVQKARALVYYQTQYQTEKKDRKIEAQQANISLLNAESKVKNQWILIGGILFIGTVCVFMDIALKKLCQV